MRRLLAALFYISAFVCGHAHAELIATPLRGDTRLVQFVYDPDNTFKILVKPKAVTHLQFAPDEVIQSVAAGDTANFELTPTKNRKNIFIKPKFDDTETSLTVITDQRTYQFWLQSTGEGKKWYQRVSWVYGSDVVVNVDPAEDAATASETNPSTPASPAIGSEQRPSVPLGLKPESLHFSYQVQGSAPFRPEIVFDDGRFTYFKLPANLQEFPALFAVIDGKDYSLVNFEVQGEYLIAQRVLTEAVLKLGKAEVRIKSLPPEKPSFFTFGSGSNSQ
jgi:type IV secretion system protein VirB9